MLKERGINGVTRPFLLLNQAMRPLESDHQGIKLRQYCDRLQRLHPVEEIDHVEHPTATKFDHPLNDIVP